MIYGEFYACAIRFELLEAWAERHDLGHLLARLFRGEGVLVAVQVYSP